MDQPEISWSCWRRDPTGMEWAWKIPAHRLYLAQGMAGGLFPLSCGRYASLFLWPLARKEEAAFFPPVTASCCCCTSSHSKLVPSGSRLRSLHLIQVPSHFPGFLPSTPRSQRSSQVRVQRSPASSIQSELASRASLCIPGPGRPGGSAAGLLPLLLSPIVSKKPRDGQAVAQFILNRLKRTSES